jgi:hypothetical protein
MTAFDDAAEDLFNAWPEKVTGTYFPPVGDPVTLQLIVDEDADLQLGGYDGRYIQQRQNGIVVHCLRSALSEAPTPGGTFEASDRSYSVQSLIAKDKWFYATLVKDVTL